MKPRHPIRIVADPCHEGRKNMTRTSKGRYCASYDAREAYMKRVLKFEFELFIAR